MTQTSTAAFALLILRSPLPLVPGNVRAEPLAAGDHPRPQSRRRSRDAAGEDNPVDPAERRRERADLAHDAVDEQVDRDSRRRLGRGLELAHVGRHARDAEQARFLVHEVLERARVHPVLVHQVDQHAGIDRAAARAHHQALDRGEAHRRRVALAALERADAGAVAEVADDRLPAARFGATAARRLAMNSYDRPWKP
jgi:hypothetical protein